MALKGLVHKVFGPPPGAAPKREQTIKPEPAPPEETAPVMADQSSVPPEAAAAPGVDTGQADKDLGPLERMSPVNADIDAEKLEEIGEKVKSEVETIADSPPTSVADALENAAETTETPTEATDAPAIAEFPTAAEEAVADIIEDAPATAAETAVPPADEVTDESEVGADDESEDGGEAGETEGGSMFDSLFSGMNEVEEDDYLSRLTASIPDITTQDLLDQAEELKALMQDLS